MSGGGAAGSPVSKAAVSRHALPLVKAQIYTELDCTQNIGRNMRWNFNVYLFICLFVAVTSTLCAQRLLLRCRELFFLVHFEV